MHGALNRHRCRQVPDISGLDKRLKGRRIDVACDFTNLLTGEAGASAVFGPQKGTTPNMVKRLDEALVHYARIIASDLDIDVLTLAIGRSLKH